MVEFVSSATHYYPGGSKIPGWVITDYQHVITQIASNGETVIKGGKEWVLLGKKSAKRVATRW